MAGQKLVAIHHIAFLVEQLSILDLTNLQLLGEVSSLVDFDYFSSQVRSFSIICRRFAKD